MQSHVLLDVRENSFERIGSIGDVEFWVAQVDEEVWKISLHAVVGAPKSAMGVVPSFGNLIGGAFLEKRSPLVVPEFQPQCELCFTDIGKMTHE